VLNIRKKLITLFLIVTFMVINIFNFNFVKAETPAEKVNKELTNLGVDIKEAKADLAAEESKLFKNQSQITTTRTRINKLLADIASKEKELKNLSDRAELNKKMLAEYIRQVYYSYQDQDPVIELTMFQGKLDAMTASPDGMISVKAKIIEALQIIDDAKTEVVETKEVLADQQADHKKLLQVQQVQQGEIVGDIKEAKATLAELQKKFAETQSELNKLLGSNYNAKDIKNAVSYASGKTGVPKGVLYGFLKKETNLGLNTGQCTYTEVERIAVARYKALLRKNRKWQASIDLLYRRQGIFYDIVKSLGYSKDKKVSCSPSGYIGQGGAMGVSQFMSEVWRGYESRITANTGHGKPDPWNLTDGIMAMALKLRGAGATSSKESVIRSASINYLGGFNKNYYEGIVYWSKNYEQLL